MSDEREESRPLSITEVLEMAPDNWINEGLIAIVRKIEPGTTQAKKKYWRCTLGDQDQRPHVISLSLFFAPKFGEGDLITITGQGIKRKEYNGKPEVGMGQKAVINVIARPGNTVRQPPPRQEQAPGPEQTQQSAAPEPAADAAKVAPYFHGQTIGMATKEAIGLVVRSGAIVAPADLDSPEFWGKVYNAASDILRVCHHLEKGRLAPGARERAKAKAPPMATANQTVNKPAAAPDPHASPASAPPRVVPNPAPGRLEDDDVPF